MAPGKTASLEKQGQGHHQAGAMRQRGKLVIMTTMDLSQMNDDGIPARCGDGKTVLVVDDHPEILLLITPWVKDLGYRVLTAADGREAQGMIQEHGITSVDLLITDLSMPRMGGGELVRWLLRENPRVRVLVMSGSRGDTWLPAEIVFLQKPFRAAAFNARLSELLASPAQTPGSRLTRKLLIPMPTKEFREPGHEEIACGAYHRWRTEGCRENNADKHWFASETELSQRQAVHDGTVWTRETQGSHLPGTRSHAAHDGTRSTGQEADNLAQRAQHTVSTGESSSVQTARLSALADEHEALYKERAAEDAAARKERLDAIERHFESAAVPPTP